MNAAVVSARFPAILPPHSVSIRDGSPWNFVDGGYSDNSGASTAFALYRELQKNIGERADIRMILLTSANPEPDLTPGKVNIIGTTFRDTVAPITAIMKVRQGLGNQAVARVCDAFPDTSNCDGTPDKSETRLKIVEIEDKRYGLALGWKLSHATFEVISWMLGDPDNCREGETKGQEPASRKLQDRDAADFIYRNSCVLRSIGELLKAK
jgi:hypothetical protein